MATAADNSTLSLSPPSTNIEHMVVRLVDYKDGASELLTLREGYSHPSLSFGTTTTSSDFGGPQLIFLQGLAPVPADVYLEALRNLLYISKVALNPAKTPKILLNSAKTSKILNQLRPLNPAPQCDNVDCTVLGNGNEGGCGCEEVVLLHPHRKGGDLLCGEWP